MVRLFLVLFCASVSASAATLVTQSDLGLRIAEGFKISTVAKSAAGCMKLGATGNLIPATASECMSRIGPDGAIYSTDGQSLFRAGKKIAQGFGCLRGFDFNSAGDLFVFDGDVERDFFLPWYVPTRLYQVALGQDHGWMGKLVKPEHYADTVDILTPIGRSSPAGLAIYRHTQFPAEYRDGIFLCDEEGRIFFCKLQKQGSTYRPRLDLFMEGEFSPRQIFVAPDGALLVVTKDSALKIEYTTERGQSLSTLSKVQEVLQAPQPLEAWSRAKWIPAARQLGAEEFRRAIVDSGLSDAERVRAVEIHLEFFGAIPQSTLAQAAAAKSAPVRARIAWALAQSVTPSTQLPMRRLALDVDATVRRVALESMLAFGTEIDLSMLPIIRQNLDHNDKRLRQAAARLCTGMSTELWDRLWDVDAAYSPQTELSLLLAASWRTTGPTGDEIFWRALETLPLVRDSSTRLQVLRVIELSLGDWNLEKPSAEVFAGYELTRPPTEEFVTNALPALRRLFGSGDALVSMETARVLAMLQDDSPETIQKIASQLDAFNSPTTKLHYLIVLARLRAAWPETLAPKVAELLKNFESQLPERERRADQNWPARLKELSAALSEREPRLKPLLEAPPAN